LPSISTGAEVKDKYLKYARDCMNAADETQDQAIRESLLEMIAAWLKLAEEAITRAPAEGTHGERR
jgi:hypothetical protein